MQSRERNAQSMELSDFSMEKTNKYGGRINKSQQWQRSAKAKRDKYKGKSVKSMVKGNYPQE